VGKATAKAADAIGKIEWLFQQFPAERNGLRFDFALASIRCGAVASLKWLVVIGFEFDHQHFTTSASAAGQLASLRYLVEEVGCPCDAAAVRIAALAADNTEILQWLSNADDTAWTTALLSELLVTAGENDKLVAAKWLRAAGAEWPTSFLYEGPVYPGVGVWSLRVMRWARASGCPWGAWNGALCTKVCSSGWRAILLDRQATQDAMLWAHAAGCPCDSRLHRAAGRLVRKNSSSSSDDGLNKDVPTLSRWNAVLFTQVFTDLGGAFVVAALLLLVIVARAVAPAVAAALVETRSVPLQPVRSVQHLTAPLSSVNAAVRAKEQPGSYKQVVEVFVAAAARALTAVEQPLAPVAPQTALLFMQQQLYEEQVEKELLEKLLMIWSDKRYEVPNTYTQVVDFSAQRTQLIKHYLKRRNLWDPALFQDYTCSRHDE
jgi:hypothetical protein